MIVGYHASHEQFHPSDLLAWTRQAEQAGFAAAMCSDHLAPWSEEQGHSAFAWSWLGSALQATNLPFGSVTTPGYRYHPVIVAQAAATLAAMYEDRYWMALGSGEALNERVTGEAWPSKPERRERLRECVDIMRALWRGETVSHTGHVTAEEARVWTLPVRPPMVVGAALSVETARWCGDWADALITVNAPRDTLQRIVAAFRERAAEKPVFLQAHVSWAQTEAEAADLAWRHWRTAILPTPAGQDLRTPDAFDAVASVVGMDTVAKFVRISADLGQHRQWLEDDWALGFDRVYLHNVGPNQAAFVDTFGASVLPDFAN